MRKRTTGKASNLSAWCKSVRLPRFKRRTYREDHFEPYTKAIGGLLLAWNDLHERLSELYVRTMGLQQFARSYAVWHVVRSDFTKREMLRIALNNLPSSELKERPKIPEEIAWILDAVNKLEGFRDDSAHTPLHYTAYQYGVFTLIEILAAPNFGVGPAQVQPDISSGNPRARRLDKSDQDMLSEYRYARDRILVLRDYALALDYAWQNVRLPWPDRPRLPDRKPSRRSKGSALRRTKK